MTEKSIIKILEYKYMKLAKYMLANSFIFKWESDFFVLNKNGYCVEFEIKISRSDFKNDKKKIKKHILLENKSDLSRSKIKQEILPNKFYYVVPNNLISLEEIPQYAGLIYINDNNSLRTIKEAPFIHKDKLNLDKILCKKFYWNWLNTKTKLKEIEKKIKK